MGICCVRQSSNDALYKNVTIAVLGLDDAGKTVTAKVLKGDPPDEVVPTIGFTNIQFIYKKYKIFMYDLGGGARIRNIWKNYFAEIHGLIFVVDSSHRERIEECRQVLFGVFEDERIKGKPVLVLGNKQDVDGAMDNSEICHLLKLDALANSCQSLCRIECCSALMQPKGRTDSAIVTGFQWLLDTIDSSWSTLKDRVEKDFANQKEEEERIRKEKAERVRKLREEREKERQDKNEIEENDNVVFSGDPFKPIDMYEFAKKGDKISLKPNENNSSTRNEPNPETNFDSDRLDSNLQPSDQKATGSSSTLYADNEMQRLSNKSSSSAANVEKRASTLMPVGSLPPLDIEYIEKKKNRRRNKRNRVEPILQNDENNSVTSMQTENSIDNKSELTDNIQCSGNSEHRNV